MWFGIVYRRWNLIGLLAALTMALLTSGYATVRRLTV
jgi:hypothetical protein